MTTTDAFRKVPSILSLGLGGYAVAAGITGTLVIALLLLNGESVEGGSIAGIFLLVPLGVLFILTGTFLWGWERRGIVLGIVLTTLGGLLTIIFVNQLLTGKDPLTDPINPFVLATCLFVLGMIFLLIGIRLIHRQTKTDQ